MGGKIVSAGGVVYRIKNGKIEVKLITTKNWSYTLPKGHIEDGEDVEDCAVREVKEESGATGAIEKFLGTAKWKLKSGKTKLVHIYLMKCVRDSKHNDPDNEVLKTEWKELGDAIDLVSFPPMNELLVKAAKHLNRSL